VVCDDHPAFRRGVVEKLSVADEGIEVVGEVRTLDEAAAVVSHRRPEVVLLDLAPRVALEAPPKPEYGRRGR
jgi:DNA-binding NarL/FixJ family response regulator